MNKTNMVKFSCLRGVSPSYHKRNGDQLFMILWNNAPQIIIDPAGHFYTCNNNANYGWTY